MEGVRTSRGASSPRQREVIESEIASRLLVLAGPGTGKTEVVARRLVHLLNRGAKPSGLLVLSFSRSAVRTLTERIGDLVDDSSDTLLELRHVSVRTFDSWTFRMLRHLGFTPGDLLRQGYNANIRQLVAQIEGNGRERIRERLSHVRHIFVDEFQDLGGIRGALVLAVLDLLAPPGRKGVGFTILGDDAQAIYGFALREEEDDEVRDLTAKVLLDRLRNTYKRELREILLEENFRATESMGKAVEAARRILRRDISGEKKLDAMQKIFSKAPEIAATVLTSEESNPDGVYSTGVLCRTNGQALRVAEQMMGKQDGPPDVAVELSAGAPSRVIPAWIGATLGRYKGANLSKPHFLKIYAQLYGAEGKTNAAVEIPPAERAWLILSQAIRDEHGSAASVDIRLLRERLRWLDVLPDDEGLPRRVVEVLTIHQSKGMEYDVVGLLDPTKRGDKKNNASRDPQEEANVLFVAFSRAAKKTARVSADGIYPLSADQFDNGSRTRWNRWWNGWVNLEIGIAGDVEEAIIVSPELFGSAEQALTLQEWIAGHAADLRGHKVVLVKVKLPGPSLKFVYEIRLQEGGEPTRLLGRTTQQLTLDLLSIHRYAKGKYKPSLPQKIYNLRIADVTTFIGSANTDDGRLSPWKESGLWVGVTIHGIGSFKVH